MLEKPSATIIMQKLYNFNIEPAKLPVIDNKMNSKKLFFLFHILAHF